MASNTKVREPGRCIFCGRAGSLSKQHIMPNRLRKIIPRIGDQHISSPYFVKFENGRVGIEEDFRKIRNGHLGTRQLRIVCKPCNEGWMNNIEAAAFDYLEPLILGKDINLDKNVQEKISAIASIIFTMIDQDHLKTSGISQTERSYIFQNKKPPPSWHIFIGRIRSYNWKFRFKHFGGKGRKIDSFTIAEVYICQIATFGLENVLFHALSAHEYSMINDAIGYSKTLGLKPIYPYVKDFRFHELPRLREASVNNVADALSTVAFQIGLRNRPSYE